MEPKKAPAGALRLRGAGSAALRRFSFVAFRGFRVLGFGVSGFRGFGVLGFRVSGFGVLDLGLGV